MKQKKVIAMLLTAALTISAGSSLVFAGTYQETEKSKFAECVKEFAALYQEDLNEVDLASTSANADMQLSLEDTSRALLGMFVPLDISWFKNVGMNYDVSVVDGKEAVVGTIYLNGTDVCAIEMYIDTTTQTTYMRIPELHDSYIMVDMAVEGDETLESYMDTLSDPAALMPDGAALETLLNRYSAFLFDGFSEDISGADTLSVEGVEESCITYEGKMYEKDAYNLMKNVLSTARNDAELKEIIEKWAPLVSEDPSAPVTYEDFQAVVDEAFAEIATAEATDETSYVSSKIWVDADNNIVGRQISFCEGVESTPFFTYKAPATATESALYLEVGDGYETFAVSGKGASADGSLTGSYDFLYDGVIMATIEALDHSTTPAEDGSIDCSYKLTVQPGIGEEYYSVLGSFAVIADYAVNTETKAEDIALSVTMSDAPLGTLSITGEYTDPVEIPDFASALNVLDAASDDDMTTYVEEMSWEPILDNCVAAGMPEEVAAQLDQLIYDSIYGVEEVVAEAAPVA